jgi:serine protease
VPLNYEPFAVNRNSNTFSFHIAKALDDDGRGSASTVIEGVEGCLYAGAKIVTLSLGGGKRSSIQEKLFRDAYDNGVLVFAASGNSGTSVSEYPASYAHVISVAAIDQDEKYASFSNFNDQVELVAPGVNIRSTLPGDEYGTLSGTSMAAPHGVYTSFSLLLQY